MIFRRNEHHFQSAEQLRPRNRDDAEIQEDAEESGDGNLLDDRRGENRTTDENVNADVRQTLIFDVDQARLFSRCVRFAVFR